jgi:putative holliday junction resolvase
MAIDYGSKRTGLAVTDPQQIIATALATVATKDVLEYIGNYVKHEDVEQFVVGYPRQSDGSSAQAAPLTDAFAKLLQKNFPEIPVSRQDESYSSKQAVETMVKSGIGKMKRRDKSLVDKIAAVIILQNYLERKK